MNLSTGVLCIYYEHADTRLVGGSGPHEGHVEIYHNGTWGTVCDDGWYLQDATVVCRELGYISATAALGTARFGAGSGPILFSGLSCIGNESIITECHHLLTGMHNCSHSEDVAVVCEGQSIYSIYNNCTRCTRAIVRDAFDLSVRFSARLVIYTTIFELAQCAEKDKSAI